MRNLKNTTTLILSGLIISLFAVVPAMARLTISSVDDTTSNASTTVGTTKNVLQENQMERIVSRSKQEIDRRTKALKKLSDRIQLMKRLSDDQKTTLVSEVNSQADSLNALKTKITEETDITALKSDAQLITKSYRIFALIISQSHIMIAVDRIISIADTMTSVSMKLQTAINEVQATGKDATESQTTLVDMMVKIADAKVKAQEAQDIISVLVPDTGDQEKFKENKDILKQAHSKIKEAHADLVVARHDMRNILQALHMVNKDNNRPATSTSETGN